MVFVTGDIHGSLTIEKLGAYRWKQGTMLTKNDVLIILGDFGLLWNYAADKEERKWLKWLQNKPFTTCVIDGNHENHIRFKQLLTIEKYGSKVGVIAEGIYHLRRGEIYTIDGKTFFVMGGARSIDKEYRIEGKSWWPEETPSYTEMDYGIDNLAKNGNYVDYILAHTAPLSLVKTMFGTGELNFPDPTTKYLQHVCDVVSFKAFYCGHFHEDATYGKYHLVYDNIEEIRIVDEI